MIRGSIASYALDLELTTTCAIDTLTTCLNLTSGYDQVVAVSKLPGISLSPEPQALCLLSTLLLQVRQCMGLNTQNCIGGIWDDKSKYSESPIPLH